MHEICAAKAEHEVLGIPALSVVLSPIEGHGGQCTTGLTDNSLLEGSVESDIDSTLGSQQSPTLPSSGISTGSPPRSAYKHTTPSGNTSASMQIQSLYRSIRASHSVTMETHQPLLPSLPSTCSLADFFECFLQVSSSGSSDKSSNNSSGSFSGSNTSSNSSCSCYFLYDTVAVEYIYCI